MRELDTEIKKNGFLYKQVFKNEKGYVYEQFLNGQSIAFEAFYRMENTLYNCISFPGNNSFGVWAWSCSKLEKAIDRITAFTCKGCGHKLNLELEVRTKGYCYLCDPAITLDECLSDKPLT